MFLWCNINDVIIGFIKLKVVIKINIVYKLFHKRIKVKKKNNIFSLLKD
jgi:hypothetical protein